MFISVYIHPSSTCSDKPINIVGEIASHHGDMPTPVLASPHVELQPPQPHARPGQDDGWAWKYQKGILDIQNLMMPNEFLAIFFVVFKYVCIYIYMNMYLLWY